MAHFAKIENGVVVQVIVAEQDFINSGAVGSPAHWVATSYNTQGGTHKLGGTPLRKNFAGIGYTYDANKDAFIPPQPYPSWVLDEQTCLWSAPVPLSPDCIYCDWDEATLSWQSTATPEQIAAVKAANEVLDAKP